MIGTAPAVKPEGWVPPKLALWLPVDPKAPAQWEPFLVWGWSQDPKRGVAGVALLVQLEIASASPWPCLPAPTIVHHPQRPDFLQGPSLALWIAFWNPCLIIIRQVRKI